MRFVTYKFILGILLAIVFLLLMDENSFFGVRFHEIAGLVICLFFLLHKALSWKFIKETTLRLFGKANTKARINYIIDFLLFIGFTLIIISGMAIAKTIDFSWVGFDMENRMIWRAMHTSVSMIVLMIVGIHIGLHWQWVMERFKSRKQEEIQ